MTSEQIAALIAEREAQIAKLRALYGFSEVEAKDFIEMLGPMDKILGGAA